MRGNDSMGNLIKPADYAAKVGISRQAVYAKIKKGILTSRNIGGKIFIVLDDKSASTSNSSNHTSDKTSSKASTAQNSINEAQQEKLLLAKDETITILRETITDLKETNKMITSTLRGEVELLKEAFGEMKMLYGLQLEHKAHNEDTDTAIEVDNVDTVEEQKEQEAQEEQHMQEEQEEQEEWLELSDFYALHNIKKKKKQQKIKEKLKKRLKKGDPRVDRFNGEILFLAGADFADVLTKV